MKRLAAALAATAGVTGFVCTAHADSFANGSFETGDFQGWTTGGGSWFGGAYPVPEDYLPGGSQYDASVQLNTVTNPGFDPLTDNTLRTAYAGNHSAQVNNPIQDYSVSVLSQRVNNYTDPLIAFAYSAVLQSSHTATDSDAFIINLTDATTNEVLYTFNLNSATAPGTFTQSSQGWYYTDWLTQSIDVSARQGHDFVLSLLANDCPYGGHAGYAYLDGFGSVVGGGGTGGGSPVTQFQYWDGGASGNAANGIVDGGSGIWNAALTNWTDATGATNGTYSPNPGSAIFTGTAGTVTVDNTAGQVAINGMQFAVDGYVVAGDAIELGGTVATVQVGDGTAAGAGYVATINAPLIGSGGLTKVDAGTLILNGVNTYTGTTTVTDGTLVGSATSFGSGAINNSANLVVSQTGSADFANRILGTGNFVKAGTGTLRLTSASPFAGSTTVAAGTLQVDGTLDSSPVTVASGATLAGNGTVGPISALAGSSVAPGSPGTVAGSSVLSSALTVNGGFAQAAGSTYRVDLTSAGASDRIGITGAATLASGAGLTVTKQDSTRYRLGQRYTVLTANGGVAGRYVVTGDTGVSLFYNVIANYDAKNVYLDVAQTRTFASAGVTPNQIAAGAGADSVTGSLHDAIGYLATAGQAQAAFDGLSGEIHATARAAAFEDSRFIREAVNDRLLESESGNALWFRGFGSWGRMDGDGNAARYKRDIGGFFVGADVIHSGALRIGLVGGYSHSKLKIAERLSSAEADDAHLGVYAGMGKGALSVRAGGSYTFRTIKTDRSVAFAGFSDSLKSEHGIGIGQGFAEVGYKLQAGRVHVEPFAAAAYVDVNSGHAFESGGAARLDVRNADSGVLFTTLGARVGADLLSAGGTGVSIKGMAGWRRASDGRDVIAPLALVGGAGFDIAAVPIAKNVLALEGGLDARLPSGIVLSAAYSGQIGDGLRDHGGKASLRVPF